MNKLLRWLSGHVYSAFIPQKGKIIYPNAETYLLDLWRDAPKMVALIHTLLATFVCFSPWLTWTHWKPLPYLSTELQQKCLNRLINARLYLFRLVVYAVRGNAFVAILRDEATRQQLLPSDYLAAMKPKKIQPLYYYQQKPVPLNLAKITARPGSVLLSKHFSLEPNAKKTAVNGSPLKPNRLNPDPAQFQTVQGQSKPPADSQYDAYDYVIVGTGAGGATVAKSLVAQGFTVALLEEGQWVRRENFTEHAYGGIVSMFRDFGTLAAKGRSVFPVMQGRCVGGSTVMNGGIMHRLPKSIWQQWADHDDNLGKVWDWNQLERISLGIETDLNIRINVDPMNPILPVHTALQQLGWRHNGMLRNAPGCQASGRCLQGCPSGGKLSMEVSYLPRLEEAGARIFVGQKAQAVQIVNGKALGVWTSELNSTNSILPKKQFFRASRGVIVSCGVVHTPLLLTASGYRHAHLGQHFQCHLGVGAVSELQHKTREVEGAPQGLEIFEFDAQHIKLATQLLPPEFLLARVPLQGEPLTALLQRAEYLSAWTSSVASEAHGTVSAGAFGQTQIKFQPTVQDLQRLRTAIYQLGKLAFQLGAKRFFPGIHGIATELNGPEQLEQIKQAPLDARSYLLGVGHLFGTCRAGADPTLNVVSPEFAVHGVKQLYVVDASVFPSTIGVNPQLAIMTLAQLAGEIIGKKL